MFALLIFISTVFLLVSSLYRTLQVILKEIGQYNFDDPTFTTLEMYFARCIEVEYNHLSNFYMDGMKL